MFSHPFLLPVKAPFKADCSQLADLEATLQAWAFKEQQGWSDTKEPAMQFESVGCKDEHVVFLKVSLSTSATGYLQRLFTALETLPWLTWDDELDRDRLPLHCTVAAHSGQIPFYTLVGYVEVSFHSAENQTLTINSNNDTAALETPVFMVSLTR